MSGQYIRKMKCLYDNKEKCRRDLWVETAAAEAAEREVLHPEEVPHQEAVPLQEEALLQEAVLQGVVGSAEGERHVYLPAAVPHRGAPSGFRKQRFFIGEPIFIREQQPFVIRRKRPVGSRKRRISSGSSTASGTGGVLPVSPSGNTSPYRA